MKGIQETPTIIEYSFESKDYDGIILIHAEQQKLDSVFEKAVSSALKWDSSLKSEIGIIPISLPASRLVYCPIPKIDDYDDVRIFKKAAYAGMKKAVKAEIKKPLIVLQDHPMFEQAALVTLLGALEALYTPLQVREHDVSKSDKIKVLGVISENAEKTKSVVNLAQTLESGRRVACDIGNGDPERMAPPKFEEYVKEVFRNSNIKMEVVDDEKVFLQEYPLFAAVNRAARGKERHRGRIIFLEYNPPETVKETLFFVGKGVTFDTGGIDLKTNGAMLSMSRDKCGAAALAGLMKIVSVLQPKNTKIVMGLSVVRNSIGSDGYVCDEILTARSGRRIRVVNTDAEGRMVMADVLCKFKEDALKAVNPHLFTVATLTGHACIAVGEGYSVVMDNAAARKVNNSENLKLASEKIGDPFEISTIRKEDFLSHKGVSEGDDVLQGHSKPSTQCERGHQGPAAFLIMASGLDDYGLTSEKPLKYSHLDTAASSGYLPKPATGSPVLALAQAYILG